VSIGLPDARSRAIERPDAAGRANPPPHVTDDPDSFVIAGTIDKIDATRGCLQVGDSVVWVAAHVLRGLDLGTSIIVSGRRDAATGRAIAELVRRTHLLLDGPPAPPPLMASAERSESEPTYAILPLVLALLKEIGGAAEVLECRLLPTDDQYAIFLQIPREISKGVLVPRRMLERALSDGTVRARVRNLLRAAVEVLRSRRAIREARVTAYFSALNVRSLRGPRCGHCEGPFLVEDPMVVREGSPWHLVCPPAW
jgi:hypothetical protein